MHWSEWFTRWLPIAALGATLLGLLDPLEGFPVILIGGVLTVMAALQDQSRHTRLATWGLGLEAAGACAMVVLSLVGGVGAATGRSLWWLSFVAPYPVGIVLSLVAGVVILRERSRVRSEGSRSRG